LPDEVAKSPNCSLRESFGARVAFDGDLQELGASASDSLQFLTHSTQTAYSPESLNLAHSGLFPIVLLPKKAQPDSVNTVLDVSWYRYITVSNFFNKTPAGRAD